jgi:hypothetical protein
MLCAPCPFTAQFFFCSFQLLHSDPSSCMNHLQQHHPQQFQQQQQPHLFSVLYIYSFCAPCACNARNTSAYSHCVPISSTTRVLCLIIIVTLQLLWPFFHSFNITVCYVEIPQPLWQLRLFVFSVTVELTFSVPVTSFNAHPAVNHLHEHLHPS